MIPDELRIKLRESDPILQAFHFEIDWRGIHSLNTSEKTEMQGDAEVIEPLALPEPNEITKQEEKC
jgi:hypothetical protein